MLIGTVATQSMVAANELHSEDTRALLSADWIAELRELPPQLPPQPPNRAPAQCVHAVACIHHHSIIAHLLDVIPSMHASLAGHCNEAALAQWPSGPPRRHEGHTLPTLLDLHTPNLVGRRCAMSMAKALFGASQSPLRPCRRDSCDARIQSVAGMQPGATPYLPMKTQCLALPPQMLSSWTGPHPPLAVLLQG